MEIQRDGWLSGIMGRGVYRVSIAPDEVPPADTLARLGPADGETRAMFFTRIPATGVATLAALTSAGFEIVDVAVTFEADRSRPLPPAVPGVEVGPVDPRHHDAVVDIAGRAFRYSRFHLDPRVPVALAHEIKRAWIANYAAGRRGSVLLSALVDGTPAGFLAVIDSAHDGRRTRTIDLVGVAPEFQGRKVGTALASYFIREYRGAFDTLQVGTQAVNVPSMRMYEKCGFLVASTAYVAHLHR